MGLMVKRNILVSFDGNPLWTDDLAARIHSFDEGLWFTFEPEGGGYISIEDVGGLLYRLTPNSSYTDIDRSLLAPTHQERDADYADWWLWDDLGDGDFLVEFLDTSEMGDRLYFGTRDGKLSWISSDDRFIRDNYGIQGEEHGGSHCPHR